MKWDYRNYPYGLFGNQRFDIVFPKKQAAHAIVFIHGGAYFTGDKSLYPKFLLDYINENILATIDYRLIQEDNNTELKDILSDITDALNKITELSKKREIAIKDFILAGHSAGGHIALLYSYKFSEQAKIAACVSLCGPTDFTDDSGWSSMPTWGNTMEERLSFLSNMGARLTGHDINITQSLWTRQKDYSLFEKHIKDISPVMYVNKLNKLPPTLFVHAMNDDQVPYSNAVRLKCALDNTPVPHQLITATGSSDNHILGGDVFDETNPALYENLPWVIETKKWMETYLYEI